MMRVHNGLFILCGIAACNADPPKAMDTGPPAIDETEPDTDADADGDADADADADSDADADTDADADADADAEPGPSQSCGGGEVYDCSLECHPSADLLARMTNGVCDDGTDGPDLNCIEFSWDGSECSPDTGGDTIDSGSVGDTGGVDTDDGGSDDEGSGSESDGPFGDNLLENPGLETGDLSGWTVLSSGGDGCVVSGDPHEGDFSLHTSWSLCEREQTIDLLASGFSAAELDAEPVVSVSDWFKERYDAGDEYRFVVELKNASGDTLSRFDGSGTTSGVIGYADDEWFEVAHDFSSYGTGLRTITFRDGGRDSETWAGHYGVRIDDSAVVLRSP